MQDYTYNENTAGWLVFVKLSFIVAVLSMAAGIIFMPGDLMLKGYFGLNALFIVSSTIMLSKTLRDEHERKRIVNRINEAKTNKIIKEYSE